MKRDTLFCLRFARMSCVLALMSMVALLAAVPSGLAVDARPDGAVFVFLTLCPKSGDPLSPPEDFREGPIKEAYRYHFENFWKECSHWTMDTNGNTTHGDYYSTKTFDWIHLPWPIASLADSNNTTYLSLAPDSYTNFDALGEEWLGAARGRAESFSEVDPLNDQRYGGSGPLTDGFWTPGEAFNDLNGDGQWNDMIRDEDRWWADNKDPFAIFPIRAYSVLSSDEWDDRRGEIYADYDRDTTVYASNTNQVRDVGFDPVVAVWIKADSFSNKCISISEFDLTPEDPDTTLRQGDFAHTYVAGTPGTSTNIPRNNLFDYNVRADASLRPLVYRAFEQDGSGGTTTAIVVSYSRWELVATGDPYLGTNQASEAFGTIVERTVTVPCYQAAELFGRCVSTNIRARIYRDTVGADSVWTAGTPAEPYEDFLSWWCPTNSGLRALDGGFTYILAGTGAELEPWYTLASNGQIRSYDATGAALPAGVEGRSDRTVGVSWDEYKAYIQWNYPGDTNGLIQRAFNGTYDGPDNWAERGNYKYRQKDYKNAFYIALEPGAAEVGGKWDPLNQYGGDWRQWYSNFFGSVAPGWPATIPDVYEESPAADIAVTVTTNALGGGVISITTNGSWMPAIGESWAYDSAREFSDLPSSIYHNHLPTNYISDPYLMGITGGDGRLGEITSPQNDEIFGKDNGTGNPDDYLSYDYNYDAAGPLAYYIHGINGFDAGNQLSLEVLTRRTSSCGTHPPDLRDTNLDGMIDQGETRVGYANYSVDDDQLTLNGGNSQWTWYPFNVDRFVEDCIEAYDVVQDFSTNAFLNTNRIYCAALHYPGIQDFGLVPSGQDVDCFTADGRFQAMHHVRVLIASTNTADPRLDVGWTQGIVAHEMSHDWFGMPDLYDYDIINGIITNKPIGRFDLMDNDSAMVHGITDTVINRDWSGARNLTNLVPMNGGSVTIDMYPVEYYTNNYFFFSKDHSSFDAEKFTFYYVGGDSVYSPIGGQGVYITHTDENGTTNAMPAQQRLGGHFRYEIVQADGLSELQDNVNAGDTGDVWPGSTGARVFSALTLPAARWWDLGDIGLKIVNIELPTPGTRAPARVTFEWTDPSQTVETDTDSDGDGLPDWWEILYGLDLYSSAGNNGADSDPDQDGLTNLSEFQAGTNPMLVDTDNNGAWDDDEDSDGDGLSNGDEQVFGTDLGSVDSDDDGYDDFSEVSNMLPDPRDNYGQYRAFSGPMDSLSPHIPRSLVMAGHNLEAPYGDRFGFIPSSSTTTGPSVAITAPADGTSVDVRYVTISADVTSSMRLSWVRLYNNGNYLKSISLTASNAVSFSETVIIGAGANALKVVARDVDGQSGEMTVTVTGAFAPADIRVTQTWSVPGDLDTWLIDPLGRHRGWTSGGPGLPSNVVAVIPGSFLDIDDIPGTGPENITVERGYATNGNYEVWMNNFANSGTPDSTVRVLVHEGEANEQFVEFGPQSMPVSDGNGSNSNAWWHVTTIQWPAGTMTPAGTPVGDTGGEEPDEGGVAQKGWTIEAWVMPTNSNQSGAICSYLLTSVNQLDYVVGLTNNRPFIRMRTAAGKWYEASAEAIPVDQWTHLAFVYGETERSLRVHVNGAVMASQVMLEQMLKQPGRFFVDTGYCPPGGSTTNYFTGLYLDELRVWSTDRGSGLLEENMNQLVTPSSTLVACYHFDDGGLGIEDSTESLDRNYDLGAPPDSVTNEAPGPDGLWGTGDDVASTAGSDGHNDYVTARYFASINGVIDGDSDGLPDWWENLFFDGIAGVGNDGDKDGLNNLYEYYSGTNPKSGDSDGDGTYDGQEDFDGDGLSNQQEQEQGSRPDLPDTDDDGLSDLEEAAALTSPIDSLSPLIDRVLRVAGAGYVEAPSASRFTLSTWMVAAWVNPDSLSAATIVEHQMRTNAWNYHLSLNTSGRAVAMFTPGDLTANVALTSTVTITTGVWTHVAAGFDESTGYISVYVNGAECGRLETAKRPAISGIGPIWTRVGQGLNGMLDEVAVFETTLSAAVLQQIMLGVQSVSAATPVCYYRFDDGTNSIGTSGNVRWQNGQVQDFASSVDRDDWTTEWRNAGTLVNGAAVLPATSDAPVRFTRTDSDGDGMPDWWEEFYDLDPSNNGDKDLDPDGDDLSNYNEYRCGTSPLEMYSDGSGLQDGDRDSDGDGLSNRDEVGRWKTDPGNPDTDDDGISDGDELDGSVLKSGGVRISSPAYSRSPLVPRSAVLSGVPFTIPDPKEYNISTGVREQRFQYLKRWVVACQVNPTGLQTGELLSRTTSRGQTNFCLRLDANVPTIEFTTEAGVRYAATAPTAIPAGAWSSVMGMWTPTNSTLALFVDDRVVRLRTVNSTCASGLGTTLMGRGITGWIDDVYVGDDLFYRGSESEKDFVFVLDNSYSMVGSPLAQLQNATRTAIDALPEGSSAAIISFSTTAQLIRDFTTDKQLLKAAVDGLEVDSSTDYNLALELLLTTFETRATGRQRIAIFVSDGAPNEPVDTALVQQLVDAGIVVNTIGFGGSASQTTLEELSTPTSGSYYAAPTADELNQMMAGIVTKDNSKILYAFYPFDDSENSSITNALTGVVAGYGAEDFANQMNWDYAIRNVVFDPTTYANETTVFNWMFDEALSPTEEDVPDWWKKIFFNVETFDAEEDPDGDGLNNLCEYRLGLNPMSTDTDGNGVPDGDEDPDGDGLSNRSELMLGTDPMNPDTDDDGLSDRDELDYSIVKQDGRHLSWPVDSRSPLVQRSMVMNGAAVTVPGVVRGDDDRLNLSTWTLEAWVNPATANETGSVISRVLATGRTNFALRLVNNVPLVEFTTATGYRYSAGPTTPISDNTWTHLVGYWSPTDKELGLSVNGCGFPAQVGFDLPAQGNVGTTTIGENLNGFVDEVRVWSTKKTPDALSRWAGRHLFDLKMAGAEADIVFLIDVTGSMGSHIDSVKANVTAFVNALAAKNVNVHLAGVRFADTLTGGGYSDTPPSGGGFYDNAGTFLTSWLNPLELQGGGDWAEDGLGGLTYALDAGHFSPTFRPDAQKIFILLTDAPVKDTEDSEEGAVLSRKSVISQLIAAGVTVHGVYSGSADITDIVTSTGGMQFDIDDDFKSILDTLVTAISGTQHDDLEAYYVFDDSENLSITNATTGNVTGYGAEDFSHRLDWDYAIDGVTFSTNAAPISGLGDLDGNGLPDSWETMFFGGSTNATDDTDGDGLNNLYEYYCDMNPRSRDTDNDGILDGNEDTDGDGLSNTGEQDESTDPLLPDTDDDGVSDYQELSQHLDPLDSTSPFVLRHIHNDGDGWVSVPSSISGKDEDGARFDLDAWTVEASVRLTQAPTNEIVLVGRYCEPNGWSSFELGITVDRYPFARVQTGAGATNMIKGITPIETNEWVSLAARFGLDVDGGKKLSVIDQNGFEWRYGSDVTPARGRQWGDLVIGKCLIGDIDEVRIWKVARSNSEMMALRQKSLLFGADVAAMGSLSVSGGSLTSPDGTAESLSPPWTVSAWFRTTQNGTLVEKQADTTYRYNYRMRINGGVVRAGLTISAPTIVASGTSTVYGVAHGHYELAGLKVVNDDQWHNATFTFDGLRMNLFVDGRFAAFKTFPPASVGDVTWLDDNTGVYLPSAQPMQGASPYVLGNGFRGLIDEVSVYNTAHTYMQVKTSYKVRASGSDLVSYFSFDDVDFSDGILINGVNSEMAMLMPVSTIRTDTGAQAPIAIRPIDIVRQKLAAYFPMMDGRWTDGICAVEDFVYPLDMSYAGSLEPSTNRIDFVPVGNPYTNGTAMSYPQFYAALSSDTQYRSDSDGDGMPDIYEQYFGFDPTDPSDDTLDLDGDGLNNLYEYLSGTDPRFSDSDGDTVSDFDEDADHDGFSNGREQALASNPAEIDSDDDGIADVVDCDPAESLVPLRNQALSLPGNSSSYVELNDRAVFAMTNWTLHAWVMPRALATGIILSREVEPGITNYCLAVNASGRVVMNMTASDHSGMTSVVSSVALSTGVWTHVAGTFDCPDGRMSLYFNGLQVASTTNKWWPARTGVGPVHVRIGQGLNAFLDEVGIYDYAMPPIAITNTMVTLVASTNVTQPLAYYRFDDGTSATNDGTGVWPGTAGNPAVTYGQVEDFAEVDRIRTTDWLYNWEKAGTLHGGAQMVASPGRTPGRPGPVDNTKLDSDFDGLPDAWELANRLDPREPGGDDGAQGDVDGDGLENLYEYLSGTDPWSADTGGTGQTDYDKDTDGDGLSNGDEQSYLSRPDSVDTDDDGVADKQEIDSGTDPLSSVAPYVMRYVRNETGNGVLTVDGVVPGKDETGERFDLREWTIEGTVRLRTLPSAAGQKAILVQRKAGYSGYVTFEMGIGTDNLPYALFQSSVGQQYLVKAPASYVVPLNQWVTIVARLDAEGAQGVGRLDLFYENQKVNGNSTGLPATGVQYEPLVLASNLVGDIDEVRIWKVARSDDEILRLSHKTLLFGEDVATLGVLAPANGMLQRSEQYDIKLSAWTVEAWFKTTTPGLIVKRGAGVADDGEDIENYRIDVTDNGNVVARFAFKAPVDVRPPDLIGWSWSSYRQRWGTLELVDNEDVRDGNWHFVAFAFDGQNAALYVDGIIRDVVTVDIPNDLPSIGQVQWHMAATDPIPEPRGYVTTNSLAEWGYYWWNDTNLMYSTYNLKSSMAVQEGLFQIGSGLNGILDEVRVFNRGMSRNEIESHRFVKLSAFTDNLVSYFDFDDLDSLTTEQVVDRANSTVVGDLLGTISLQAGIGVNAPIRFSPVDVLALKLAAYWPMDDGQWPTNTTGQVEDFLHKLDYRYAGTFSSTSAIHFVAITNTDNAPWVTDSDGDGMPDWYEVLYSLDPSRGQTPDHSELGPWGDPDNDGLPNLLEYRSGMDPFNPDTDVDGIGDYDDSSDGSYRTWGYLYDDGDQMDNEWEEKYPTACSPLLYDAQNDPDGDGWSNYAEYLAQTDPSSRTDYPEPSIRLRLRYDGTHRSGNLMFRAYTSERREGVPSAIFNVGPIPGASVPGEVMTFTLSSTNLLSGHFAEGTNWFSAFIDSNGNGIPDYAEPADHPYEGVYIGWDRVDVELGLTDYLGGYGRFSWTDTGAASYWISICLINPAGHPFVYTNAIAGRTFLHEGDFRRAGQFGATSGGYLRPVYEWFVEGVSGGYFTNAWAATIPAPVLVYPVGSDLVLAQNEFVWNADTTNTQFEIEITQGAPGGTIILNKVFPSPYRDSTGKFRYVLPIYAGDGPFTNGVYYWRLRAISPASVGTYSAYVPFTIKLQDVGAGAYSIAGRVSYYGRVSTSRIIVQAFASAGFGGRPVAQVTLSAVGAYSLRGLGAGAYSVRAFTDLNGNGLLDSFESFGLVKNTSSELATDYMPASIIVPASTTGRNLTIRDVDTDNDDLPDGWEYGSWGDLWSHGPGTVYSSPPYTDADNDGVNDLEEYQVGSNPNSGDSDGDGLDDGIEYFTYHTSLSNADSDGDGLNDNYEVSNALDPNCGYDDDSGVPTSIKLLWDGVAGYNPVTDLTPGKDDSDGDGVSDLMEIAAGSDPLNPASKSIVGVQAVTVDENGHAVVEWNTYANSRGVPVYFILEYTENLIGWQSVGSWISDGASSGVARVTDSVPHGNRDKGFYRLRMYLVP